MKSKWTDLEQILIEFIKNSRRPDYIDHATTTRNWLLKLYSEATEEMKMSAFAHDIERCFFERMLIIENEGYSQYKARHAQRCADILSSMMIALEFPMESITKVHHLVSKHEIGGDFETDLIRDADSLSFMSNNLPGYLRKNGKEETVGKIRFMYDRASEKAQKMIKTLNYSPELKNIVNETLK